MLGKQQTENVSCKTNLYSILFYSMGWSHTIALQPQGRVFAPQLYTCTHGRSVSLQHPRSYSLTLCQYSLTRNQPRWISPAPKPQRVKQQIINRFFPLSTISGCFYPQRFPCLCFQDPLSFPQPVSDLSFPYNLDPVQVVKRDFVG